MINNISKLSYFLKKIAKTKETSTLRIKQTELSVRSHWLLSFLTHILSECIAK